jgi:hypothetical protein
MNTLREIERLRRQWGELHIDIDDTGKVVVSDRDASLRPHTPSRTYTGSDLWLVLEAAIEGEQA